MGTPSSSNFDFKLNHRSASPPGWRYWVYLAAVLVLALSGWFLGRYLYDTVFIEVRREAEAQLILYGDAFSSGIHRELGLLDGLRAFMSDQVQEELRADEFAAFAGQLLANAESVRYVAATPNGVDTFYYPAEAAEDFLSLDLFFMDDNAILRDLYQTLKTHQAIVSAPQELQPGGDVVVLVQTAVYNQQDLQGIASMVVDVRGLLRESGLEKLVETYTIALRDQRGVVFYGDKSVFETDSVRFMVRGGAVDWELGALPKVGWGSIVWSRMRGYLFAAFLISILILWTVHLMATYQYNLAEAVRARTDELQRSENRYRTLVEQAADAIIISAPDGKILEANASAQKMLGYSEAELLEMRTQQTIHPDDLVQKPLRVDFMEQDAPARFERDLVRKDGRIVSVEGSSKVLSTGNIQSIFHDSTEQKQAAEALRRSETLFRVMAENAIDVIYRFRLWPEFGVDYISPSCARIIGYTAQEITEHPDFFRKHVHPQDRQILKMTLSGQEKQDKGIPVHLRWTTREGKVVITEHHSAYIRDESGRVVALEGIARDITARIEAERALQSSEDRFARIFQASPDQIVITRLSDGMVLECNQRFEELTGYRCDEVTGRTTVALGLWSESEITRAEFVKKLEETGVYQRQKVILKDRYGKSVPVAITARLLDMEGERCALVIIRDLSDVKAAQSALVESESRYRSLFEENSSVILLFDPQNGQIVDANTAACRYYGYTRDQLLRINIAEINQLPEQELFAAMEKVRLERQRQFFFRHRLASGEIRHVEVYAGPIWAKGRQLLYSIVHDVHDRMEREQEQAAILETAAALRLAEDRETMIPIVLDQVVRLTGARMAGFFEPCGAVEGDTRLELGRGDWGPFSGQALPCVSPKLRAAVRQGEPVRIDDLRSEINEDTCHFLKGVNALMMMPLVSNEEHIGTLCIGRENAFTRLEERLVAAIADMAANAIRRDSLFHDLQASTDELARAYDVTLAGWAKALELRDKETEGHSQRVTEITVRLARKMGFSEAQLVQVRRGALLHDIGKMGIPDAILHKPGQLTGEEWEIMRMHPVYAYELLKGIDFLAPALEIPYCHHEWWDGSGYPRGLRGEEIPLAARIFALVDVWDALLSDRPYRLAWPEDEVREYLQEQAGSHFDPEVVQLFMEFMADAESIALLEELGD